MSKERKSFPSPIEPNNQSSSIWEKLTPEKALILAEKILKGIESGNLPSTIYEPITDRLIKFACEKTPNNNQEQTDNFSSQTKNNHNKIKPSAPNNQSFHRKNLRQLPLSQKEIYNRRRQVIRDIYETNRGRKNKKRNLKK